MSPVLWGQPNLHLSGVLCSKEPQRLLASTETSGGGKYLGKAFLKLGTHRKKTSWIRFPLLTDLVPESKQPLSLSTSPAAQSIMEVLWKILYVRRGRKGHMRKVLEKNGWFLNMKSLERREAHSPGMTLPQSPRLPAEPGPFLHCVSRGLWV